MFWRLTANDSSPLPHQPPPLCLLPTTQPTHSHPAPVQEALGPSTSGQAWVHSQSHTGAGAALRDPPACCAWMSFPYTASADSISVRLVWIIWREGQHEELATPGPLPPGQVDGDTGLITGCPLHQCPGSGPPHLTTHGQVWCDQHLASGQVPFNTKEGSSSSCGYLWDFSHLMGPGKGQAVQAQGRGCSVPGSD